MGEKRRSGGCCGWFLVAVILAVVAAAIVLGLRKRFDHHGGDNAAPVPGPPGAIEKKYADSLSVAMQFFDVQKCKPLFVLSLSLFRGC